MLGPVSQQRLDTCHPKLQRLFREVDRRLARRKQMDITVVCGHRGEADQEAAFAAGKSKKHWPDSKHNGLPSNAVDVSPYPIDWNDKLAYARLAGYVFAVADDLDIQVRWLGDGNQNGKSDDESFLDIDHFELTDLELNRP